jgi:urease accessory protein
MSDLSRLRALRNAWPRPALTVILMAITASRAWAHSIQGVPTGFAGGFEHPLTGPDHFLAMFAVGVWGAQMGGRSVWTLPVVFPLIMTMGGIAGMSGVVLPHVETGIALSVLVLGLAIRAHRRLDAGGRMATPAGTKLRASPPRSSS